MSLLLNTFPVLLLFLAVQGKPKPVSIPTDFAIRVNYGDDVIDTFQDTYTRLGAPRPCKSDCVPMLVDSTIVFKFTSAENLAIYKEFVKINFAAYPENLKNRCSMIIEPGVLLIITIRANNKEKVVSYYDECIGTRSKAAERLRALSLLVLVTAAQHKEIKNLPKSMNIHL